MLERLPAAGIGSWQLGAAPSGNWERLLAAGNGVWQPGSGSLVAESGSWQLEAAPDDWGRPPAPGSWGRLPAERFPVLDAAPCMLGLGVWDCSGLGCAGLAVDEHSSLFTQLLNKNKA